MEYDFSRITKQMLARRMQCAMSTRQFTGSIFLHDAKTKTKHYMVIDSRHWRTTPGLVTKSEPMSCSYSIG